MATPNIDIEAMINEAPPTPNVPPPTSTATRSVPPHSVTSPPPSPARTAPNIDIDAMLAEAPDAPTAPKLDLEAMLNEGPLDLKTDVLYPRYPTATPPQFVDRITRPSEYPTISNADGTKSTHLMADAEVDGKFIAYPTLVLGEDGSLKKLEPDAALTYALENNEYAEFDTADEAKMYSRGGYKQQWAARELYSPLKADVKRRMVVEEVLRQVGLEAAKQYGFGDEGEWEKLFKLTYHKGALTIKKVAEATRAARSGTIVALPQDMEEYIERGIPKTEQEVAQRTEAARFGVVVASDVLNLATVDQIAFFPGGALAKIGITAAAAKVFPLAEKYAPGVVDTLYTFLRKPLKHAPEITRFDHLGRGLRSAGEMAGAFGGYAVMTGELEDAGVDALVGALTGLPRVIPKLGWFDGPIKFAMEGAALAGGHAILKDEPMTKESVAHIFATLLGLKLVTKGAGLINVPIEALANRLTYDPRLVETFGPRTMVDARRYLRTEYGKAAMKKVLSLEPTTSGAGEIIRILKKHREGDTLDSREIGIMRGLEIVLHNEAKALPRILSLPAPGEGDANFVVQRGMTEPQIVTARESLKTSHTTSQVVKGLGDIVAAKPEGERGLITEGDLVAALQKANAVKGHANALKRIYNIARLPGNDKVYYDDFVRTFIRETSPLERVDTQQYSTSRLDLWRSPAPDQGGNVRFGDMSFPHLASDNPSPLPQMRGEVRNFGTSVFRAPILERVLKMFPKVNEHFMEASARDRDPMLGWEGVATARRISNPLFFIRWALSNSKQHFYVTGFQKEHGATKFEGLKKRLRKAERARLLARQGRIEHTPIEAFIKLENQDIPVRSQAREGDRLSIAELERLAEVVRREIETVKKWREETARISVQTAPDDPALPQAIARAKDAARTAADLWIEYHALNEEIVARHYERLGAHDPTVYWQRVVQETVKLAAERIKVSGAPSIAGEGPNALIGWAYFPRNADTGELFDRVKGLGQEQQMDKAGAFAREFFRGRKVEEVDITNRDGTVNQWLKIPVFERDVDAQYELGGVSPDVMPARMRQQFTTTKPTDDILRRMDMLNKVRKGAPGVGSGGGWNHGEGGKATGKDAFDPKDIRAANLRFRRSHMWFNTLMQNADHVADMVPAFKTYVDVTANEYTQFRVKLHLSADKIARDAQLLSKEEFSNLTRAIFEANGLPRSGPGAPDFSKFKLSVRGEAVRKSMDLYHLHVLNNLRQIAHDNLARTEKDPELLRQRRAEIHEKFNKMASVHFFPETRFGKWNLIIHDKRSNEILGSFNYAFEFQANKAMAAAKLEFLDDKDYVIRVKEVLRDDRAYIGMPRPMLEALRDIMRVADQTERADALDKFIVNHTAGTKFAGHMLKRKHIPGYSEDVVRAFSEYAYYAANHLAAAKYSGRLNDAIADVAKQKNKLVYEEGLDKTKHYDRLETYMKRHYKYVFSKPYEMDALKSGMFHYYFALVPVAGAMNLSQIPLATYPALAARFGDTAALKEITRAAAQLRGGMKDDNAHLSREQRKFIRAGQDGLWLNESIVTEISGFARGNFIQRLSPGNKLGKAMHQAGVIAPWAFTQAEIFNRHVTGLAAFNLARKRGDNYKDALEFARDMVRRTQFEYARFNRPAFMRGPASPIFLFVSYFQQMMYFLGKDTGNMRALAVLFASAGVSGLPGAEEIFDVIDMIMTRSNPNVRFNSREEFRRWLVAIDADPHLWMHGILGIPGFGSRVSMGNIPVFPEGLLHAVRDMSPKGIAEGLKESGRDATGAAFSLLWAAADAASNPSADYMRRLEMIYPPFMRYLSQARRAAVDGGYTDPYDALIFSYDENQLPWRVAAKALGLTFADEREERDFRRAVHLTDMYYAGRQQQLLRELALGVRRNDRVLINEAMLAIQAFNKEAPPGMAIRDMRTIVSSLENHLRSNALKAARAGRTFRESVLLEDKKPLYGIPHNE